MTENLSLWGRHTLAHASTVRAYLEAHRAELVALLAVQDTAGVALGRRHAEIMDGLLRALFAAARFDRHDSSLVLGAVGGYGRRLLGLRSDLDVCFVTSGAPEGLLSLVESMLYPLWDAGVSVGHQVVSIADVIADAVRDLPTATELLDFRTLAGDEPLARVLQEAAFGAVFSPDNVAAFITRLEDQANARHERFGDSVYLLEPDVKNGTGGLRDLDLALWAARARLKTGDLDELANLGILTRQQLAETRAALDFLWAVRNHLHQHVGRRYDRLTFAEQEVIAKNLGYAARVGAVRGASEVQLLGAMVEAFMSDYYRHARVIARSRDQIIGHAKRRSRDTRPHEEDLGEGLIGCEGGIGLRDPEQLANDPALALRLYATAVSRALPVLARSRDAVARAAAEPEFCAALRDTPEAARLFTTLVCTCRTAPFRTDSILSELHDVGLLLAMIPEFAPVVGRVHHDLYHVYTVDVHSIAAVDRLRALTRGDLAREFPLACRLAAEVALPKTLFLATLLHDVGKAIGGHDHARRGADMAREILARLGLAPEDIDDASHLVLKHLSMYVVAARRDLGDPATIAEFAGEVRGREGLRDLYLLTVADLSTTSPTSMTKWKAGLLESLYRASDALLSGTDNVEPSRVARVRAQVRALWRTDSDAHALDEFLETMPERYLLANRPEEIAAHARVAMQPREAPVAAALIPSRDHDVMELCIVTDTAPAAGICVVAGDRPGLLASIAAAIAANRLEIHAAQVNSRPLPGGGFQAVDLFWVRGPRGSQATVVECLPKLQRDLREVITGKIAPGDLVRKPSASPWRERQLPPVFTEIVIDHRASARHTVIEVLTQDRPGLLFALAQDLHALGLTIAVAKINTEGTRVIDVFYVTEADGKKLDPGERSEQVRERLMTSLTGFDLASRSSETRLLTAP